MQNDRGEILIKVGEWLGEYNPEHTRYNGGWAKVVLGLDKSRTNGYSLVGEFVKGAIWVKPGALVLDCSIGGSRRRPNKGYALLQVQPDGTGKVLETAEGRTWAVDLWPAIERGLGQATSPEFLPPVSPAMVREMAEVLRYYAGGPDGEKARAILARAAAERIGGRQENSQEEGGGKQ